MDFSTLKNEQLREECTKRGLPVSGSNPELIARLNEYDGDDLLAQIERENQTDPTAEAAKDAGDVDAVVKQQADQDAARQQAKTEKNTPPAEPAKPRLSVYRTAFECPGELSTGVHLENLRRVYDRAVAAGYSPRGGANGAARTGFASRNGKRYAMYEINVHKQ